MIGTLQEFKDYLGERSDASDARLTVALVTATELVNAYCRRKSFESVVYTAELQDGTGTDTLQLDNYPLTDVATVLEDGTALVIGLDPSANPSPDVLWYAEEGHLVRPSAVWWAYPRFYSATYTAGYSVATMPPIVKQAAYDYAALLVMEPKRIGLQTKTAGQQTASFVRDLPTFVKAGLDYYRDIATARSVK